MKKSYRKILFLCLFLTFAVLLRFYLSKTERHPQSELNTGQNNETTTALPSQSAPLVNNTAVDSNTIVSSRDTGFIKTSDTNNIDTWDADTIYTKADKVIYKKNVYQAKWWTQGEKPDASGEWGVWELTDSNDSKKDTTDDAIPADQNPKPSADPSNTNIVKGFKIVGYYPDWQPAKEKNIQYNKLTHINYSFAIPTADGKLRPFDNPELAKKIIKNGHKNKVKVLVAVGGWSYNGTPLEPVFVSATKTDKKCKAFAENILKLVDRYGFDGVDIDWEHPRVDGNSAKQYEKLMKYLRAGLTKRKKLLTSAVLAGVSADGSVLWDAAAHSGKVLEYVNWINVMAYDGGDGDRHSTLTFAKNSANYWLKTRKLAKSKVVLGVPFYARPSWASYSDLLAADTKADTKDISNYQGMEAHYNGLKTIRNKTNFALKNAGGIMIWELSQDTTNQKKSLLSEIYQTAAKK